MTKSMFLRTRVTLIRIETWVLFGSANAVMGLYILIFSISPNTNGEDLAFSKIWNDESPLARFRWIFARSIFQINDWNARRGEQLSIFWLNMPPFLFTIVAAVSFFLLAVLTSKVSLGVSTGSFSNKRSAALAFLVLITLWPSMDVFFWKTTQAGYLQPILIYLVLVIGYQRWLESESPIKTGQIFIFSLGSFFAGLSFENTPIVLGGTLLSLLLSFPHQRKNVRMYVPFLSLFAGWSLLISAPSTRHRVDYFQEAFGFSGYSWEFLTVRLRDVLSTFAESSWVLLIFYVVALIYLMKTGQNQKLAIASIVSLFLNCLTLIPSPYTEPRSFIFSWLLMIAIVLSGLTKLGKDSGPRVLITLMFGLAAISTLLFILPGYQKFADQLNDRDSYMRSQMHEPVCLTGLEIKRVGSGLSERYLNNRDAWVFSSLDQVSARYNNCNIFEKQE